MWINDFLTVNGARLHYLRTGGAKPALILLHGFTDSAAEWWSLTEALEADYDVIMIDTRGHGESDAPPADFTLQDQARDVEAVMRALGVTQAAVIGHSMGAVTAIQLAVIAPELLTCLILEDPPLLPKDVPPADFTDWKAWLTQFKGLTPEERLEQTRASNSKWHESELQPTIDSKVRFYMGTFDTALTQLPDWRPAAPRIHTPTLLITGDSAGAINTPQHVQEAASLWGGSFRAERITGAGHNVRRDQPAAYLKIVTAFLNTCGDA